VKDNLAQVINIKLAKCGVVQALEIAEIARANGTGLMIGGMVETRIAMGFSAHFAAGLGGFDWIDLDTPLLKQRNLHTVCKRIDQGHLKSASYCRIFRQTFQ